MEQNIKDPDVKNDPLRSRIESNNRRYQDAGNHQEEEGGFSKSIKNQIKRQKKTVEELNNVRAY